MLDDLTVVRSANTVRAHAADVHRWIAFCQAMDTQPFEVRPGIAIEFIRQESERASGKDRTVSTRSIHREELPDESVILPPTSRDWVRRIL